MRRGPDSPLGLGAQIAVPLPPAYLQETRSAGKLPAGSERGGCTSALRGGRETRTSGWRFPTRNAPRESGQGAAPRICCVGGAMTSQDAVWLTPDLPVERRSMQRRPGDPPTGNARAVKVVVVVSFGCALIIHVACGCLIEMNILLL